MALLKIIKLSTKTWKHNSNVDGDFILTKFYAKQEDNEFLLVETYGAKRRKYLISEIEVYDIGGTAETFSNFTDLFLRLEALKYPAFYVDGEFTFNPASYDLSEFANDGTDKFVKESEVLSNDISTYTSATTPLAGTELALINDGTGFKKVAVSEFVGDLQSVTDKGNTTTNNITTGKITTPMVKLPKGSYNVDLYPVDLTANRKLEAPNKNGIIATLDDIPSNPITGTGANGQVAFFNGTNSQTGDNGLFWDNTNKRLGVGSSATPQAKLDVRAQGALSTDIAFRVRNSADTQNFLVVNGAGDVYNKGAQGLASNTYFGENIGRNATGTFNTLFGYLCGRDLTTGNSNTLIGSQVAIDGNFSNCTMIGTRTGEQNKGGSNTFIGSAAALYLSDVNAGENIIIGYTSAIQTATLTKLTYVNSSIFIGNNAKSADNSSFNQIVIGNSAIGLGSNTVVLGNTSITRTALRGQTSINTDTIDASAQLQVDSTTRGFLPPRMTTTERNAIASPAAGLVIYNTTTNTLDRFNGTSWNAFESVDNKVTDLNTPNNTSYPTTQAVVNENKKATITVELIDLLTTNFYAPNALRINSTALISGSGTITLKVNDVAYTLGNLITQGQKITVETTTASVYNLISIYE